MSHLLNTHVLRSAGDRNAQGYAGKQAQHRASSLGAAREEVRQPIGEQRKAVGAEPALVDRDAVARRPHVPAQRRVAREVKFKAGRRAGGRVDERARRRVAALVGGVAVRGEEAAASRVCCIVCCVVLCVLAAYCRSCRCKRFNTRGKQRGGSINKLAG